MAPSRRGKRKAAAQPATAAAAAAAEPAWDPFTQAESEDEEVWDPHIDWELERIVGMEISNDGTKHYEVRWGADWKRDDDTNTTWVDGRDENNDVFEEQRREKFERILAIAAARKAKASQSIDLNNVMLAWPHDRATAECAEAREEKLDAHRRRHAGEYDPTNGHLLMDWDSDIIRLGKDAPEPPSGLQRRSFMRSESRTLSDAGTPQPFRASLSRPARRESVSIRSESHASTLRPESRGPRAASVASAATLFEPEPATGPSSAQPVHQSLHALETQWSHAAQAAGAEGLVLVNDVDDELPGVPPDFRWIENSYVFLPGREPVPQYLVHCQTCDTCSAGDPCNCIKGVEDAEFDGAYDEDLLLEPLLDREHGFVVRECNPKCNCGDECLNKVSQESRRWTLEIFKTDNGRGWGVRTQVNLQRGKILGIYTGVLRPPSKHDDDEMDGHVGNNYSFALDGHMAGDDENAWSVNSYRAGNWTRFVNHSCGPNMRIYSRTLGEYTKPASDGHELYYIVFVAKQDISADTELTLDYRPGEANRRTGRQKCACGAVNCRGWLYM
ncbi:SET domain-containing protein [Peniophora sp. CONT]|nr:SET domain-containing protein [Peniophora sp. CONT]